MTKKQIAAADFAALSQEDQLELLRRDGAYVGKLKIDGQHFILVQLYSFYIELVYKEYRKVLSHLIIHENVDILLPYLDQVKIKDLDRKNPGKEPE